MNLVSARGLSVSLGGQRLLKDADIEINDGERIGLVGPNGSGKTSLLRTLIGEVEPDRGEIVTHRGLRIALLRQLVHGADLDVTARDLVHSSLPADIQDTHAYLVDVTLEDLGVPPEMWDSQFRELSGGWQRLVKLAAVGAADPNLLILDEPTNFLDIENIVRLETWLTSTIRCACLIISHDRALLDSCTNRTLILHDGGLVSIPHPFSDAMAIMQERQIAERRARDAQDKEIQRLTYSYKRLQHWGHTFKVKKLSRRAKNMAQRVDRLKEAQTSVAAADRRRIELRTGAVSSEFVLRMSGVDVRTPDGRHLFRVGDLVVRPGERLVLLGRNGIGKSSLMRLIDSAMTDPDRRGGGGPVSVSPQVRHTYFEQDLRGLPDDISPLDFLEARYSETRSKLIGSLVAIGIPYAKVDHPIDTLSGGQRSRLLLLGMGLAGPNCLLLDEPTNHLDIEGMEQLEHELCTGDMTALIISHDRRFITEVGTRYLVVSKGQLTDLEDLDTYFEGFAEAPAPAQPGPRTVKDKPKPTAETFDSADRILQEILELESRYADPANRPTKVESRISALYEALEAFS